MLAIFRYISNLKKRIEALQKEAVSMSSGFEDCKKVLALKENALAKKEEAISKKEECLNEKISELDALIAEYRKVLRNVNTLISDIKKNNREHIKRLNEALLNKK